MFTMFLLHTKIIVTVPFVFKLFSHNEWPVRVIFLEDFPRKGGRNKISRKELLCEMEKKVHQNVNEGIVNLDYLT